MASLITPSWSIERFENCGAVCIGADADTDGLISRVDVWERMEAGLADEPWGEGGRLEEETGGDVSGCCDAEVVSVLYTCRVPVDEPTMSLPP